MNHDESIAQSGRATRRRWARWAPRLMAVILAADCTGGAPPKPKADVAQAGSGVHGVLLARAAAQARPISGSLSLSTS